MSGPGDRVWPEAPPPAAGWPTPDGGSGDPDVPVRAAVPGRPPPPSRPRPARRAATPDASRGWGAPASLPGDLPGRDVPAGPGPDGSALAGSVHRRGAPRPAGPRPAGGLPRSGRAVDASGRRVRVRVVERFPGQRVRHHAGPWRRVRSAVVLVITALVVGAVLAAGLSAAVWGISVAVHHATTN